jgi:hypothetical protein
VYAYCRRLPGEARWPENGDKPGDITRGSGWSLHCGASDHAPEQWQQQHLTHLIHSRPFVMPYLCMPEGSMVVFDAEGAIVWGAGSESGARDPEDPRAWIPPA